MFKTFNEFRKEREVKTDKAAQAPDEKLWAEWKSLANMSEKELKEFFDSKDGKKLVDKTDSKSLLVQMIPIGSTFEKAENSWTPEMWSMCKSQVSTIKRKRAGRSKMKGNPFERDDKKTNWYLTLLSWGHDPKKRP